MKNALLAVASLTLIFGFIFASSWYKDQQAEKSSFMAKENVSTFVRDHSQTLGSDDAKVYIVEFMDPACETCAVFAPFVKKMMADNPGKIKLVLRYAPFHDGAEVFVSILEAARKQGKYWETLDAMFKSQAHWASHHNPQPERVWEFISQIGLDMVQLKKDMKDPAIAKLIAQDMADAKTLNVRKTPGYFVNGRPLQEFGYRQLHELVQSELQAVYKE
ncbi:MAG: thioredoxin domain-containing protein [Desulfocapsa sp.]|uniref:Thioredoxin domain-containing protein n=1 Tax=Desulfotalea psychrophila TaxID=84980 RepID=A0ABS3AW95_9BACT|nr:thioredoxin domain-containing protein [Desulfocapsa sp.]MBN4068147.1 thioredoxin domain-containing protein [Desulfotalea psychrophila]